MCAMANRKGETDIEHVIESIVGKFRKFDVNGDGVINEEELTTVLMHMDPAFWSTSNVFRLMHDIDRDHNGQIEYEEFVRWSLTHPGSLEFSKRRKQRRPSAVERTFGQIPAGEFKGPDMVMAKADAARAAIRPEEVEDAIGFTEGLEPEGAAVVLDALIELLRGIDPIVKPLCTPTPSGMTGAKFFATPTSTSATPMVGSASGVFDVQHSLQSSAATPKVSCTTPAAGSDFCFDAGPMSPSSVRSLRRLPSSKGYIARRRQLVRDRDAFTDSLGNLRNAVSGGWVPARNIGRARARLMKQTEEGDVKEVDVARKSKIRVIALLCIFVESLIEYVDMTKTYPDDVWEGRTSAVAAEDAPLLTLPKLAASQAILPIGETLPDSEVAAACDSERPAE